MKNLLKRFFNYIKNKWLDIQFMFLVKKWQIEDRKYRENLKFTDPNIGCGRYGVPCHKCPRNTRCWL